MGLLDAIGSIAGPMGGTAANNPKAALVQAVLGMLVHGNEPGGLGGAGGLGGLGGLLQRFQNAGLGDQVASWIGTGTNQPIDGAQVKAALGGDPLTSLATHAGLDEDEAANHLASVLPSLIDRLTPTGQVSSAPIHEDALGDVVKSLFAGLGAKD